MARYKLCINCGREFTHNPKSRARKCDMCKIETQRMRKIRRRR